MTASKIPTRPSGMGGGSAPRRRVLIGVGAIIAAAAMISGPAISSQRWGAIPSARADACPAVEVVFARGTGEPPGIGRVGEAFVNALRPQLKGKSAAVYGINYPASDDFLRATDGADDASRFVQNTATTCPDTQLVLGGYSQGAAVVDILTVAGRPLFGFTDPLPADLARHVAAVAVFGNPSDRIGGPLQTLSPLYGGRTIDLCNGGDPVCSNGNDVPAHSLYVQTGMAGQAAAFVAQQLAAPAQVLDQTAGGVDGAAPAPGAPSGLAALVAGVVGAAPGA